MNGNAKEIVSLYHDSSNIVKTFFISEEGLEKDDVYEYTDEIYIAKIGRSLYLFTPVDLRF